MDDALWQFPESEYPCRPDRLAEYLRAVEAGIDRMRGSSAAICGLARDVADALPWVIARVERLGAMFGDYRVVLVENDSKDDTVALVRAWQSRNPAVTVLSQRRGLPSWGPVRSLDRAAQLASCRNQYLDHALRFHGQCAYVIVLDSDIWQGFSYDGVAHSFGHDAWDAIGSYAIQYRTFRGVDRYPVFYDVWAFREVGHPAAHEGRAVNPRTYRRGDPLTAVWSCFGGLAIYRMKALAAGARYHGSDCEHVTLHFAMRARGFGRIYFNPSQIVLIPPPEAPGPDARAEAQPGPDRVNTFSADLAVAPADA